MTPERAAIVATIKTLRFAATWLNDDDRDTLRQAAEQVELVADGGDDLSGEVCCPVCEEVACDDDCPLDGLR